jgi:hypothetical protein
MNIPNLPTDNLYKFIALSGVFIYTSCLLIPIFGFDKLDSEILKTKIDLVVLKTDEIFLSKQYEELENDQNDIIKQLDKYRFQEKNDSIIDFEQLQKQFRKDEYREYYEFIFNYYDKIFPSAKLIQEWKSKRDELNKLNLELNKKSAIIVEQTKFLHDSLDTLKKYKWIWFIGTFVGSFMCVIGFKLWYCRVQKFIDIKIKLENFEIISKIENQKEEKS